MPYRQMIAEVTGVSDPIALQNIEYEMRANLTGLDHLTARQFAKLARESAECVAVLGAITICTYAANLAFNAIR